MNTVNLSGNVASITHSKLKNGGAVTNILLAVDPPARVRRTKSGVTVRRSADYIPIVVWGANAITQAQNVGVGSELYVTGRLHSRKRVVGDTSIQVVEVTAEKIEWIRLKTTRMAKGIEPPAKAQQDTQTAEA